MLAQQPDAWCESTAPGPVEHTPYLHCAGRHSLPVHIAMFRTGVQPCLMLTAARWLLTWAARAVATTQEAQILAPHMMSQHTQSILQHVISQLDCLGVDIKARSALHGRQQLSQEEVRLLHHSAR
jgi:hypothetical protein